MSDRSEPREQIPEVETETSNVECQRDELLDLAEAKEIKYTVSYIKKASDKTLEKIYQDYKRQQLRETNKAVTYILISKFSELLENLNMTSSAKTTGR